MEHIESAYFFLPVGFIYVTTLYYYLIIASQLVDLFYLFFLKYVNI